MIILNIFNIFNNIKNRIKNIFKKQKTNYDNFIITEYYNPLYNEKNFTDNQITQTSENSFKWNNFVKYNKPIKKTKL
jgi:hypothetical protein